MKLVVVPASRGCKSIPRNDTKSFCDKPVIKRLIEGVLLRGGLDKTIVDTATDIALANDVELTEGKQKRIPV